MGNKSRIQWTDHTFNPWWGCSRISEGCDHCYAAALAKRTGYDCFGDEHARRLFGDKHWRDPYAWNRAAEQGHEPAFVFCGSMCDIFERNAPFREFVRLTKVMTETPWLIWLLLTKRSDALLDFDQAIDGRWPLNVWAGVTAENRHWFLRRVSDLRQVRATRIFVSYEPALGALGDITPDLEGNDCFRGIDWLIAGCESNGTHPGRPASLDWFRDAREQCVAAVVPFFLKQAAVDGKLVKMPALDGEVWSQRPSAVVEEDLKDDDGYCIGENDACEYCGGAGYVEYLDHPDLWDEDCPNLKNHLVTCPDCEGKGVCNG